MSTHMRYELRLTTTAAGVGYFACHPMQTASFDENLAYLRERPLDEFMHKYLLDMVASLDEETIKQILDMARDRDPLMVALICEASHSFDRLSALRASFGSELMAALLPYTPLITIKSALLDDQELHNGWTSIFEANMSEHRPLPTPESAGLPLLHAGGGTGPSSPAYAHHIEEILARMEERGKGNDTEREGRTEPERQDPPRERALSAEDTARRALERLEQIAVFASEETRHTSSLSPHGFLRKWQLNVSVRNGGHDYSLHGIQTSYGKGLTPEAARASYAMEMVERVSSFAGFGPEGVLGYTRHYPLVRAAFTQLGQNGTESLNPNELRLEVPYIDEPIHWLEAEERFSMDDSQRTGSGLRPRLIPAQSVFLFCNLDEVSLFSGLGSTGLASGNTMDQAKASALLEVIERDCEATTLYEPSRCFKVEAEEPLIASLLSNYRMKGVHIQFQDLTQTMGVPCYKCFVIDDRGVIVKGTGAHLDARKALLSALTETPFAFPGAGPSAPGPGGVPTVNFQKLPNYSTGDPSSDLEILEAVLLANGFRPLYVDLTRKDLGIPVVKAIVPGMEFMADFDRFSRVSPRLFAAYLRSFGYS